VLKRLQACKGSPERECTHRFRFRPAHPLPRLKKETLLWHATCRAKRWFCGRCHYDLRHDQTMSDLCAAIDQAKTDRYSPLLMRQARMARVALSGKQEDISAPS
jgi:hypothetical protein